MPIKIHTLICFFFLISSTSYALEIKQHTSFFEFDKYKLSKTEKIRLYRAIRSLDKASFLELKAYTDQVGSVEYNMALSQRRAIYVRNFLISKLGLSSKRLKAIGLGWDTNQVPNSKKRRVDIFVMPKPKKLLAKKTAPENLKKPLEYSDSSRLESKIAEKNGGGYSFKRQESTKKAPQQTKYSQLKRKKIKKKAPRKKISRESNRYYFGLGLYQNVLDAEDNIGPGVTIHAEWVSRLNFDILAAYQINFLKNFWMGLEGRFQIQDYEIELDNPYVWDEKDPRLYSLALISDYERETWGLGFDVKYGNEPFIFENNNDVTLELSNMLSLKIRGKYKFYESKSYSSRLGLSFERALFGSGFLEPKGEFGALAYIDLSKKNWFKKHEVNFRLYYGLRNFVNNENDQQEKLAGFQIRYRNKRWL